jgi:hypothetical protein
MSDSPAWSGVVAVYNDEHVLQNTLLRSNSLAVPGRLLIQRKYQTVAAAYNAGILQCTADVVVFLHPDVYLPDTWETSFNRSLQQLEKHDPNWGVLGLYGVRTDGAERGFLYSTGRQGILGSPFQNPQEVRTVDEFVFAIRRSSGLSCDGNLPSAQFQLGATDLCLDAERRKMKNYVIPCFTLHNSNRWSSLPLKFWPCYWYIRNKWKKFLPVKLPYTKVTRGCAPMLKNSVQRALTLGRRNHRVITRVADPVALYNQLRNDLSAGFGFD